jgi:hypothetical protein
MCLIGHGSQLAPPKLCESFLCFKNSLLESIVFFHFRLCCMVGQNKAQKNNFLTLHCSISNESQLAPPKLCESFLCFKNSLLESIVFFHFRLCCMVGQNKAQKNNFLTLHCSISNESQLAPPKLCESFLCFKNSLLESIVFFHFRLCCISNSPGLGHCGPALWG